MTRLLVPIVCVVLAFAAPPALADGSGETSRFRVQLDASETVTPGSAWEFVLDVENLTDHTIKVRSQACMRTPFGPLCGPVPSPRKVKAGQGVQVAALMLCEEGTPLGDYRVEIVVTSGSETLTIPHTISVIAP